MKKLLLLLFVLLITTSLFAYQNNQGVGFDLRLEFSNAGTNTNLVYTKIFYTFMTKYNVFEIAPYFALSLYNEKTNGIVTDGYLDWAVGSMFYWHFVNTKIVSVSTGLDAGIMFGNMDSVIYTDTWNVTLASTVPIVLDINLGSMLVVRITQNIAGLSYYIEDSSGSADSTFILWGMSSFNPSFGFIFTF